MQGHFWDGKPVVVTPSGCEPRYIASQATLLSNVQEDIAAFNLHLNALALTLTYKCVDTEHDIASKIVPFIRENYVSTGSRHMLLYDTELIFFFLGSAQQSIILAFYIGSELIGVICGAKHTLKAGNVCTFPCVDINFLCISKPVRNTGVSSYMIGVMTKECVQRMNVICASYTVGVPLRIPKFNTKCYYHRPINMGALLECAMITPQTAADDRFLCFETADYVASYVDVDTTRVMRLLDCFDKQHHQIYFQKDETTITNMLKNGMFHVFQVGDNIFSFYRLDTLDTQTNKSCRVGYLYFYALTDFASIHTAKVQQTLGSILEAIAEKCKTEQIFDMLTVCDPFGLDETEYNNLKYLGGSGALNYYLYNLETGCVKSSSNGLVTI